jgi:hypothetical protein
VVARLAMLAAAKELQALSETVDVEGLPAPLTSSAPPTLIRPMAVSAD